MKNKQLNQIKKISLTFSSSFLNTWTNVDLVSIIRIRAKTRTCKL